MHIETLKIFCDLADLESFSHAAERNFITQSAVSQQIRTLEEKFKRRLLERVRGRREVKLTPAGEVFYRESKSVLAAYDQLEESLRGVVGKIGGTVKVATIYSIGLHELPQKVREFMTKFPAAKIDLEYSRTTRVVRDVLSGDVELGILAFPEHRKGLTITPMPDNRLVLIAPPSHKFAGRKKVRITDLAGQDFVHFERDVPTRKAMDRMFKAAHVDVKKVAEFDNIETIKRAVEVGFGLAIVPETAVSEARKAGTLAVIPMAEKYWVRSIGAIHRSDHDLSLGAKKFLQLLTAP
jgi:DNA-binding transcriptional LysR family regulator